MNAHPMDDIPVRQLRFRFDADRNPLWSRSSPRFSRFMNALGIHVPYFERFLVAVMREYRDELSDPDLRKDVQAIIGQEAHHAFNFVKWTESLVHHHPDLAALDSESRHSFDETLKHRGKKFKIGFTAGYETFTFLAGMIILNRYHEFMADADSDLRAFWVWHQVEEVEHGAVAFDFYQAFFRESEWYRKTMVARAFCHIATETFRAHRVMLKETPFTEKLNAWRFFVHFAFDLAWAALPVLKAGYHPRNHPICNNEQNRIAVAWREYHSTGNDAHTLTDSTVKKLLGEPA